MSSTFHSKPNLYKLRHKPQSTSPILSHSTMDKQVSMLAMRYHIFVWKVIGAWDLPGRPKWYTVWCGLVYAIFFIFYPGCMLVQMKFVATLGEMIDILLIVPSAAAGVKGFFVILQRHRLRRVFDQLQRMDEEHLRTDAHRQLIMRQVRGSMSLVKFMSAFYYSTAVAGLGMAVMSPVRRLLYQSWYPIDYRSSTAAYYTWLMFQWVCSFIVSFAYSSLDIYGPAMYKVLGAHLEVLRERLNAIGDTKFTNRKNSDGKDVRTWSHKSFRDGADRKEMASCVDYHNMCIK